MKNKITSLLDVSLLKFLLIGGITTAIDFVIYTVLGQWLSPVPLHAVRVFYQQKLDVSK